MGIPSLEPTQRGTPAAPMTLEERELRGVVVPAPPRTAFPLAAHEGNGAESEETLPHSRRAAALEQHWYECLLYPVLAWRLVAPLALGLTALTGVALLAWTNLEDMGPPSWWIWLASWAGPFLILGYTGAFLQGVLASGAAGETGFVRWPGTDLRLIVWALAAWLVGFLAGPIVFAAAALWFWLYAGDPGVLDWLVIIELCVAGTIHWLLALVAIHQGDRLADVNPVCVGRLVRRLGYRAVLGTVGGAAIGLAVGHTLLSALTALRENPVRGWILLFAGWLVCVAWLTFLFRMLGLWCFRSRVEAAPA